jgi:hypothetical protein
MLGGFGGMLCLVVWGVKRTGADPQAFSERLASKPVRLLILLLGGSLTALTKLYRTPGQRVAGIRRADARSGAPVSLRQALIFALTPQLRSLLLGLLTRPLQPPGRPVEDHRAALKELRRVHAHDADARREATMEYFRSHRREWSWRDVLIRPLARTGLTLLVEVAVRRRWPGRSLGDVLAHTTLIVDR